MSKEEKNHKESKKDEPSINEMEDKVDPDDFIEEKPDDIKEEKIDGEGVKKTGTNYEISQEKEEKIGELEEQQIDLKKLDNLRKEESIDISEKLSKRFSNDPKDLFNEIKRLEDRYQYTIDKMNKKYEKKISTEQDKCAKKYHNLLNQKKDEVTHEVNEIEEEIEKNLNALDTQEAKILKTIKNTYEEKSDELIEHLIKKIGLNF